MLPIGNNIILPVAGTEARTVDWKMAGLKDGRHLLQAFNQEVLEALE